jgi:hypothetical protein
VDGPDAGFEQHPAACVERRARRHHIVDERDRSVAQPARGVERKDARERPERERVANVGVPSGGRQARLRRTVAAPPQHPPDRQAEVPGQIVSLVEPPPEGAPGVERHGHDRVDAGQGVPAGLAHQRRKRVRQGAASAVLEGVDDFPERTVVSAGASRERELRALPATADAKRAADAP